MKVIFVKPCKQVLEQEDGTYALVGLFHELAPRSYPVELPPLHVAIEFEKEAGEPDEVSFGLRFRDPSSRTLWEMEAPFRFVPWPDPEIAARFWATVVIESPPTIEGPGVYWFDVSAGRDVIASERIVYGVT